MFRPVPGPRGLLREGQEGRDRPRPCDSLVIWISPKFIQYLPSCAKRARGSYENYGNNPLYPPYLKGGIEEKMFFWH